MSLSSSHPSRRQLQSDRAIELRVGGLSDLTYALVTKQGGDVVVLEARAGSNGQWVSVDPNVPSRSGLTIRVRDRTRH